MFHSALTSTSPELRLHVFFKLSLFIYQHSTIWKAVFATFQTFVSTLWAMVATFQTFRISTFILWQAVAAGEDVVFGDDGPTCNPSLPCHHHVPDTCHHYHCTLGLIHNFLDVTLVCDYG